MQVKIMRGIPGSGKSTFAKTLAAEAWAQGCRPTICSADDFFIGPDHVYRFDATKLDAAHRWCMEHFIRCLQDRMDPVIVDNTNINLEDVSPYVAVGRALGYDVEIIQVDTPPDVCASRNIHGVPPGRVFDMHKRLMSTKLPTRFKVIHVTP